MKVTGEVEFSGGTRVFFFNRLEEFLMVGAPLAELISASVQHPLPNPEGEIGREGIGKQRNSGGNCCMRAIGRNWRKKYTKMVH